MVYLINRFLFFRYDYEKVIEYTLSTYFIAT
jgi:hypothetical protein